VPVIDSGLHAGRYFYVMDYINGPTLDRWVEAGGRGSAGDLRAALALLAQVCEAVEYAHQRGVLHRDLKPANVLIDESGAPHVLDFGLAKDIAPLAGGQPAVTLAEPGAILGTLAYMSPEQARGANDQVSVRSDVYALGVMAYERVTGRLPCDAGGAMHEVLNRIISADPARPSHHRRGLSPDVDAILLRALEKSPDRRYSSVAEFAADIRRYLANEPVLARSASAWYRAKKFVRRNRVLVAAAGTTTLALVLGVAGVTWQMYRAIEAETVALQERDTARLEADKANEILAFTEQMLASADPKGDGPRETTVREVLDRAAAGIDLRFDDRPLVAAAIRKTLGRAYLGLGLYQAAEGHLRAALETQQAMFDSGHPAVAEALTDLGRALAQQGDFVNAERCLREALKIQTSDPNADWKAATDSLLNLATLLYRTGRLDEAEQLARDGLEQVRSHDGKPELLLAHALNSLALVLNRQGDLAAAENMYREAESLRRALLPHDHPLVMEISANLAIVLCDQGKFADAELLLRRTLEVERSRLGADHPDVATTLNDIATVVNYQGRYDESERLSRESLAIREQRLGPDHESVAACLDTLATALIEQGGTDEAEAHLRRAIEIRRKSANDPISLAISLSNLGSLLKRQKRYADAEPLFLETLEIDKHRYGADHPEVAIDHNNIAGVLWLADKPDAAAEHYRRAVEILDRTPDPRIDIQFPRSALAVALIRMERYAEAEPLLQTVWDNLDSVAYEVEALRARVLRAFVTLYENWHNAQVDAGRDQKAAEWRERYAHWRTTTQPQANP
jgi:tetratricopeptide (TPR) repeat protein